MVKRYKTGGKRSIFMEAVMVVEVLGQVWTRKHDDPAVPVQAAASRTVFLGGLTALQDLIELCAKRHPREKFHAAGSHWALSTAAISDHTFIETHDPNNIHPPMDRTLFDVVPDCLHENFIARLQNVDVKPYDNSHATVNEGMYPVCFETGKRVYQLYSELDDTGPLHSCSLAQLIATRTNNANLSYSGPWAFPTLGGAGGQTVFGALHTGTHGGDINLPPIAGAVVAMHLVADGGKHFWLERETLEKTGGVQLTDNTKLKALYGTAQFGGSSNFEIIRNDNLFNAVLISAGRFGVVYSVVAMAVRQYTLHEERRLMSWQETAPGLKDGIKDSLNDMASQLYTEVFPVGSKEIQKFLQIAICVSPNSNMQKNIVGVTKRWNVKEANFPQPPGRAWRVGNLITPMDQNGSAAVYAAAGNSHAYEPVPGKPGQANFLSRACADGNFMVGVMKEVIQEIDDFVNSGGAVVGAALGGAAVAGVVAVGGGGLLALLAALAIILIVLVALVAAIIALTTTRFPQVLDLMRNELLNRADPKERAAGVFIFQAIVNKTFADQQSDRTYDGISYAVMDGHDYLDLSCNLNVRSTEVFFDATSPRLVAYIDRLLAFEKDQQVRFGRATAGYISLRFTGPSPGLIGQQKWPVTCAVEVSGLADTNGSTQMVMQAIDLALDPNFGGVLHWGQQNDANQDDIELSFGDVPGELPGNLTNWRAALSKLTENGMRDGFSSAFTRQTGLEVVAPKLGTFEVSVDTTTRTMSLTWDCVRNPPQTSIEIEMTRPDGIVNQLNANSLQDRLKINVTVLGNYDFRLKLSTRSNGQTRSIETNASVFVS
jgi:hypothetical protein